MVFSETGVGAGGAATIGGTVMIGAGSGSGSVAADSGAATEAAVGATELVSGCAGSSTDWTATGAVAGVPPERNAWVAAVNDLLRAMARDERVALADSHRLFTAEPAGSVLFTDHVHPSDRGYDLIAKAFFEAISRPLAASTAARGPLLFRPPAP